MKVSKFDSYIDMCLKSWRSLVRHDFSNSEKWLTQAKQICPIKERPNENKQLHTMAQVQNISGEKFGYRSVLDTDDNF